MGDRGSQLDLLLLKAESYSNFILENQKRTQELHQASNKKRARASGKGSASKKARSGDVEESDAHVEENLKVNDHIFPQPPNLVGGTLLGYQLEGLQWLLSLWENGLNGILADEMGLGKTIQIISLIAHLRHHNTAGPYLIAGPLATVKNWVNEFKKWLPSCPVVLYHGSKDERAEIRRKYMRVSEAKNMNFPVVITSFEMCIIDRPHLERYVWQYIILDEGHRIKNRNCKLIRELKNIKSISRLLLTGTPIQNSLEELWSLLNFCSPMIFDDLEVFQSWFDFKNIGRDTKVEDIVSTEEQDRIVTKLHEILRPFVLRRLKSEVLGDRIVPKRDIVLYCGMSSIQREFYSMVLDGTLREKLMEAGVEEAKHLKLLNNIMQLRKVCNHPFVFGDLKDPASGRLLTDINPRLMIAASGKFKLLDRMLPRLKRDGHKVLIFSQFTTLLDVLEDYLHYAQHSFVRFDGSTKLDDRQEAIDNFNDPKQGIFIFLLSTRSGGLGINLTAADTIILFDSDWNPHQDSQAQARCHRIGQTRNVVSYRLLTSGSIEIDIMKKQISKKKLERLTIEGGDYRKAGKRDSHAISIDDLKVLLDDDVKNLARMEKNGGGGGSGAGGQGGSAAMSILNKEISEYELGLVMDRELLFRDERLAKERLAKERLAREAAAALEGVAVVEFNDAEKRAIASILPGDEQEDEPEVAVVSEAVSLNGEAEPQDGQTLSPSVPIEGDMYDIVTEGVSGMLSTIK